MSQTSGSKRKGEPLLVWGPGVQGDMWMARASTPSTPSCRPRTVSRVSPSTRDCEGGGRRRRVSGLPYPPTHSEGLSRPRTLRRPVDTPVTTAVSPPSRDLGTPGPVDTPGLVHRRGVTGSCKDPLPLCRRFRSCFRTAQTPQGVEEVSGKGSEGHQCPNRRDATHNSRVPDQPSSSLCLHLLGSVPESRIHPGPFRRTPSSEVSDRPLPDPRLGGGTKGRTSETGRQTGGLVRTRKILCLDWTE